MDRTRRIFAVLILAGTFLLYAKTCTPSVGWGDGFALPVPSSALDLFNSGTSPVYAIIIRCCAAIPFTADQALRFHLVQAFVGACAIAILFLAVSVLTGAILKRLSTYEAAIDPSSGRTDRTYHGIVAVGAGLVAALATAFSESYWNAVLDLGPAPFDALLISIALYSFIKTVVSTSPLKRMGWTVSFFLTTGLLSFSSVTGALFVATGAAVVFHSRSEIVGVRRMLVFGAIALSTAALLLLTHIGVPSLVAAVTHKIWNPILTPVAFAVISILCVVFALLLKLRMHEKSLRARSMLYAAAALSFAVGAGYGCLSATTAEAQAGTTITPSTAVTRMLIDAPAPMVLTSIDPGAVVHDQSTVGRLRWGFARFLMWNFVGRAGDVPGSPAALYASEERGPVAGHWTRKSEAYPNLLFGIPLIIGLFGCVRLLQRSTRTGIVIALLFIASGVVIALLDTSAMQGRDNDTAYVPVLMLFGLWIGTGTMFLAELFARVQSRAAIAFALVCVIVLAVPGRMVAENWDDHDRSRDVSALEYGYNLLQSCDAKAVLFINGNTEAAPVAYLQGRCGVRTDVSIIDLSLLHIPSYAASLVHHRAAGTEPVLTQSVLDSASIWAAQSDTARSGSVFYPISMSRGLVREAMSQHFAKSNGGSRPDSGIVTPVREVVVWQVEAMTTEQPENRVSLSFRDFLVHRIVAGAVEHRPVLFSVAIPERILWSMKKNLCLEGLAWRLLPVVYSPGADVQASAIKNEFFQPPASMQSGLSQHFLLRSLERGSRSMGNTGIVMSGNYRNIMMRYAHHALTVRHDTTGFVRALQWMLTAYVDMGFTMSPSQYHELGSLLIAAGYTDQARRAMDKAVSGAWSAIAANPRDAAGAESPYRTLLDIYSERSEYPAMLAVLDTMSKYMPQAEDIRDRRRAVRAIIDSSQSNHQP